MLNYPLILDGIMNNLQAIKNDIEQLRVNIPQLKPDKRQYLYIYKYKNETFVGLIKGESIYFALKDAINLGKGEILSIKLDE